MASLQSGLRADRLHFLSSELALAPSRRGAGVDAVHRSGTPTRFPSGRGVLVIWISPVAVDCAAIFPHSGFGQILLGGCC